LLERAFNKVLLNIQQYIIYPYVCTKDCFTENGFRPLTQIKMSHQKYQFQQRSFHQH